ncbi:MAG: M48 family metallopeptidase [Planctomycetota bacterium]|jgi:predicted metal-dependent hydrolase
MTDIDINYRRSRRARNLRITISPDAAVVVTVPTRASLKEAEEFVRSRQAWIEKHLAKFRAAQQVLGRQPELTGDELVAAQEDQYDLPYNRAAFRCQKTKWGSCSSADNISLNINIAFLPKHLQDHILLHELCHVRHKNHSKAFWGLLDEYCGGKAKQYAK